MRALLLGATGLVGGQVLKRLLAEPAYTEVRVLLRKKPADFPASPKLDVRTVDFGQLEASHFDADHIYCCLGTTIRQAGSQEAFRRVDYEYAVNAAKLGARAGARKYLLISAVGANARSRAFYMRVKGETETAVGASGIPEIHVFRPSLLLGHRAGSRPLEQLSIALIKPLAPLLAGPLARYRPIEAATLAQDMVARAVELERPGLWIHEGSALF